MTVSGDTRNTAALSSTLSPPKNFISITRLFRWSSFANASSASSSATRSGPGSCGRMTASSKVIFVAAPPRFSLALRSGVVHEDAPHQPSRHREKVRAVLPVHLLDLDQP